MSRFLAPAAGLLHRIEDTQADAIAEASRLCAEAIGAGGLVHVFGTGHSRIPVEELFPRYGSYPGFNPIVELSMTFHTQVVGANGQRQAMYIERVEGLAEHDPAPTSSLRPPDAMMVFSAGGTTAVPIEMAHGRAAPRAARRSRSRRSTQSRAGEPQHSSGTRLLDHADVVLDLCTPAGDALVTVDGLDDARRPGLDDRRRRARERDQGADGDAARRARRAAAGDDERGARRRRRVERDSSTPRTPSTRGG